MFETKLMCILLLGGPRSNFTKGGVNFHILPNDPREVELGNILNINKNREGFYGWMGLGGSIVQWHPELKIGFAFVPTLLDTMDMFNARGAALQQIVKDCSVKSNK